MPKQGSLRANPVASRKLDELVASGAIREDTKPSAVYNDPKYAEFFQGVNRDAIRRRLRYLLTEKMNDEGSNLNSTC